MNALTHEPFVIISASKENYDNETNIKKAMELKGRLSGRAFKVCYGCYQGAVETSFYVPGISESDALELAAEFDQECVLSVDQFRAARLVWQDKVKFIGTFEASEDSGSDYTIIDGIRFCCNK